MRVPSITFLAVAAVFSGCLTDKDADHSEARSKPAQRAEVRYVLPDAVAPSIYGPAVLATEFDFERPLDYPVIVSMVAIRVAPSVRGSLELPSLPTDQLPRGVHRPEFLIDSRVQSLPE